MVNELVYSVVDGFYAVGNKNAMHVHANGLVNGVDAEGEIVIPKRHNNVLVTKILNFAFRECLKITSIKIEAPIKSIGNAAFYHCVLLESLVIPKTVEFIDACAFSMYKSNTNIARMIPFLVVFEKGTRIKEFKNMVFEYQVNLTLILPVNSLPALGSNLFLHSTGETNIYAYRKDLNMSGILTKRINPGLRDRVVTCINRKSRMKYLLFIMILML